mgnify:CR=1 FL=1
MKKVIIANIFIIIVFAFFLELSANFFKLSNLKGIEPGLIITNGALHQMSPNNSGIHFGEKIYTDKFGFRVPSNKYFYKKKIIQFLSLAIALLLEMEFLKIELLLVF